MRRFFILFFVGFFMYSLSIGCSQDGTSPVENTGSTSSGDSEGEPTGSEGTEEETETSEDEIPGPYGPQGDFNNVDITVKTQEKSAVYEVGDQVVFEVKAFSIGKAVEGNILYTLSNDKIGVIKEGILPLVDGEVKVKYKQEEPMVLRCTMTYLNKSNKEFKAVAAAAVAPLDIPSTTTEPADFSSFWRDQIDLLEDVPLNAQLRDTNLNIPNIEVYDLTLDNIGDSKFHGYFGKLKGDGPYPAILYIPGAGVSSPDIGIARNYASDKFLVISSTVHDLPNGKPGGFYDEQEDGPLRNYFLRGRNDREEYYYHRVILGCIQAINYLTGRPEWDQKHLIVMGSSQGGGLTLMVTALDDRVTAASANVPALSEHEGRAFGRPSGWPQLIPFTEDGVVRSQEILDVSRYYDVVNFAKKIQVPTVVGVGLIDDVCHPTTVFSAYNEINAEKDIDIAPLMGHSYSREFGKLEDAFVKEQSRN